MRHVVIIGNGVAGFSAARCLRQEEADLTISIFSDEEHPFYLRGRLKDYIAGALGQYEMILENRNLYRRERLNLFLQSPVAGLDTVNQEVVLAGGERVHYDRLLLAMGCRPAPLPVPGSELRGVFSLRTMADAEAIRQWLAKRRRAVVLGEGIVSLQLAEGLARLGAEVDYLLLGERFWPDALDAVAAAVIEERLLALGVRVHKRMKVSRIVGAAGAVAAVELEGGTTWPCQMVGHGCSFRPNTELLAGSPVQCDDGVVVDEFLETSVKGVFAAGDVVSLGCGGKVLRRASPPWVSAFKSGQVAALGILDRRQSVGGLGLSLRTEVAGVNVAVVGRGHLGQEEPGVEVVQARSGDLYRRLVFEDDVLVGAILLGDTAQADMLEDHVRCGTSLAEAQGSLLAAVQQNGPGLEQSLDSHCPICTDQVRVPAGTLIGAVFQCLHCQSRLKLAHREGRPTIVPADGD
jgi:NAD(P)H-nitrite reductase large subunit